MFDDNRLKDPGYFRENRLDPHSDHECRPSYRLSLNGLWKFFHAKNPAQIIPGFEQPGFDCRSWDDIHVPAHIQLEGWGHAQYCNTEYPWDGLEEIRPGQLPESYNPVACYVKHFCLPEEMAGKRVFISFQGAESCVAVWLNGTYIGFSSDSFTPHEFELTDALCVGENKLACRVYRWCAGSWLEDQDFLRFSGLYRDVYLYAIPAAHLWDLNVTAEPDESFAKGVLRWKAGISAPEGTILRLRLKDGKAVLAESETVLDGKSTSSGKAVLSGIITADRPRLWSSEDPYLYDLEVILIAPDGSEETALQRVGFRKIEIRDSVILINGVRVVFKGVNRHDFCGETGRAVTEEKLRRDLLLMKRNNINAIRTSHYPNSSMLYRLCDELGLYVIDENNMESHGMWDMLWQGYIGKDEMFPGCQKEWEPLLLDRIRSVVGRDRNHPSVVIWSCGNESLTGTVILEMSREFKRLDPSRPVHYEGDHQVDALYPELRLREITDIESEMYTPADRIREYLKTHREKPFILCEYTHSMGNSNGAMHKYTEMAYEEELYQGGFIWDFIDQALVARDRFGHKTLTYGGDWDDRPTDGIFCGNGIVFADGRETPKLQEVKYNYQNIVVRPDAEKMEIVNRHMFTSTSAFRCVALLEKDGKEIDRREIATDVPPLSSAVLPLPFGVQTEPGEYAVTVSFRLKEDTPWAQAGYETAFGQGVWKVAEEKACRRLSGDLSFMASPWNISVRGEHFSVQASRLTGALTSYRWGNKEMLKTPLLPNFWRAPINNDYGNRMPQRYAQWKIASLYASTALDSETMKRNAAARPVREADGSVAFTLIYGLPTVPAASCAVSYRVRPCGRVDVRLDYDPVEGLGVMPEFGMITKLDADYNRVRFYGLGPEENYIDRREGARLGIWDYCVADNMTPYLLPQECGNRTGVRWAEITDAKGQGLKLWLNSGEFSALPWTPHEIENAAHGYELPPVSYTVLKMSAIQMGVGGDDSWGARTHPEYLPDISKPLGFEFSFRGI